MRINAVIELPEGVEPWTGDTCLTLLAWTDGLIDMKASDNGIHVVRAEIEATP